MRVDVLELGVAVRVALPLDRLAVGLEAVARARGAARRPCDGWWRAPSAEAPRPACGCSCRSTARATPGRLGSPGRSTAPGRRWSVASVSTVLLRPPPGRRMRSLVQVVGGLQLGQARGDRTPRDPRGAGDPGDAAATDGGRLGCGGKSPGPFVEERGEHLESGSDLGFIDHALQHIAESGIRYTYFVARPKRQPISACRPEQRPPVCRANSRGGPSTPRAS